MRIPQFDSESTVKADAEEVAALVTFGADLLDRPGRGAVRTEVAGRPEPTRIGDEGSVPAGQVGCDRGGPPPLPHVDDSLDPRGDDHETGSG